jgi:hypothetical protein
MESVRWSVKIPGRAAVRILGTDPECTSVYVADGWGVAYAALRLRRLDLATGEQLAAARLGNAARCITFYEDEVLAATDTKVFRLEPKSLETLGRWDSRVPRYADALIAWEGKLLMANWSAATVSLVELDSWTVRRLVIGDYPQLVPTDGPELLAYSRGEGNVFRIDLADERPRAQPIISPGAGHAAAYDEHNKWLWILGGVPTHETITGAITPIMDTFEDFPPATSVVAYDMDSSDRVRESSLRSPATMLAVSSSRRELWALGERLEIYDLASFEHLTTADLPQVESLPVLFPEAGVAFGTAPGTDEESELICVQI